MEPLNALTPNTAAFLDSLTSYGATDKSISNAAFPPSTFFPIPGRDTPEESSPDSINDPKAVDKMNTSLAMSDDSDADMPMVPGQNKRKAHRNSIADGAMDEDDDEDSLSETGHEDKRLHANEPKSSRRKSSGAKDDKRLGSGDKPDKTTKAQRRKEQNRAAQKAFRERREQKVRDLEAKVAELEAKSFGASVENENLRGILRRLQEENVALKQAAFTFSMPINGQNGGGAAAATSRSGQQTPIAPVNTQPSGIDWSQFASFKVQQQVAKPPSPPQSVSNDSLRSIHEVSPPNMTHRASNASSANDNSPEPLVSIGPSPSSGTSDRPMLFGNGGVNRASQQMSPLNRSNSTSSPTDNLSTPSSIGGSRDDVEALFRSLYPNGIDAVLAGANNISNNSANLQASVQAAPASNNWTFLSPQSGLMSMADSSSNTLAKVYGDATSYRDASASVPAPAVNLNSMPPTNPAEVNSNPLASQAQWADLTDNSVSDFLASLTGANGSTDGTDLGAGSEQDAAFSRQLEALIAQSGGTSPSAPFLFPNGNTTFSPGAYLNMSPSPLQSLSNSQTPQSTTGESAPSTGNSPHSQVDAAAAALAASSGAPICGTSKVIHVLGEDGRVMRPSEVWTKMGMTEAEEPGDFLIDDLCEEMKKKATCKDGRRYLPFKDVAQMVREKEKGSDCDQAIKREMQEPVQSQAQLNEAYIAANGGHAM